MNSRPATAPPPPAYWVGVDVGRTQITAGVFAGGLRFLGKFKKSTKPERGAGAVIARVARCVQDAMDECDLALGDLAAVGVGVPGTVDGAGRVVSTRLGWEEAVWRTELEQRLGARVRVENVFNLGTLGVYTEECPERPRTFAAIFWGTDLGGGFCADGQLNAGFDGAAFAAVMAQGQQAIARLVPPELSQARGRDLRKALRRGDRAVTGFIREAAGIAGAAAASVVEQFAPEVLALGGGVMEEMKEEWMAVIEQAMRRTVPPGRTRLMASALGGNAAMYGGAVLAAQAGRATEPPAR